MSIKIRSLVEDLFNHRSLWMSCYYRNGSERNDRSLLMTKRHDICSLEKRLLHHFWHQSLIARDPIPEMSPGAMQSGPVLRQALCSPLRSRQQDSASRLLALLPHYASAVWRIRASSEHCDSVVNTKLCSNTRVLAVQLQLANTNPSVCVVPCQVSCGAFTAAYDFNRRLWRKMRHPRRHSVSLTPNTCSFARDLWG